MTWEGIRKKLSLLVETTQVSSWEDSACEFSLPKAAGDLAHKIIHFSLRCIVKFRALQGVNSPKVTGTSVVQTSDLTEVCETSKSEQRPLDGYGSPPDSIPTQCHLEKKAGS